MHRKLIWAIGGGLLLVAAILLPRIFQLGQFMTADEKRWLANTAGFTLHLAHAEWDNLLQLPHPGITLQWFGAATIFSSSLAVQKIPVVLAASTLILLCGYVYARLWGTWAGVMVIVMLAVNPFLVAHTRVYAMDALLATFIPLSLGCLLVWRQTSQSHYLWFAGATASAVILSKLPGILLIPFTLALFLWWLYRDATQRPALLRSVLTWALATIIGACLILPSLLTNTANVLQEFAGFFTSDDYQELHQAGTWYYLRTMFFFSTPAHFLLLPLLVIWWQSRADRKAHLNLTREQAAILLLFCFLFFLQMTVGLKKGDRYILPVFTTLDVLLAGSAATLLRVKQRAATVTLSALLLSIVLQGALIARLHPYTLAYVNPITKPWFDERRLGWGEGLDQAANYLNQKPDSPALKVASYYPVEFGQHFRGEAVPVHQHDEPSVDYVVLYRAMYERGPEAWESDVLNQYRDLTPEAQITLNGINYAWIYAKKKLPLGSVE